MVLEGVLLEGQFRKQPKPFDLVVLLAHHMIINFLTHVLPPLISLSFIVTIKGIKLLDFLDV